MRQSFWYPDKGGGGDDLDFFFFAETELDKGVEFPDVMRVSSGEANHLVIIMAVGTRYHGERFGQERPTHGERISTQVLLAAYQELRSRDLFEHRPGYPLPVYVLTVFTLCQLEISSCLVLFSRLNRARREELRKV